MEQQYDVRTEVHRETEKKFTKYKNPLNVEKMNILIF
jgi:hypothetical protein